MRIRIESNNWVCLVAIVLMTIALPGIVRGDPVVGQLDDFSGGSSFNWQFGHGVPDVVATGGPDAADSPYLKMNSTGGFGAQSKMVIFNNTQWTGDYNAAGIAAVQMKLLNLSGAALTLRWVIQTGSGSAPGYCSTNGYVLPADSAWHSAVFPLNEADMTAVGSPPSFSDVFSSVAQVRLLESSSPSTTGDSIVATVGVADITAVAAPEPQLAMLAFLVFPLARRK